MAKRPTAAAKSSAPKEDVAQQPAEAPATIVAAERQDTLAEATASIEAVAGQDTVAGPADTDIFARPLVAPDMEGGSSVPDILAPLDEAELVARLATLTADERASFGAILSKLGCPVEELARYDLVPPLSEPEVLTADALAEVDLDGRVLLVRSVRAEGRRRAGMSFTREVTELYSDQLTGEEIGALLADPELVVEID